MPISKTDIVREVAQAHGITQTQVRSTLDACLESILGHLQAGESVKLQQFGSFAVKERAARKARNPQTGEQMDVPASRKLVFKPASTALGEA